MARINKSKQEALFELASAIAALKNPQCHYDLANDDVVLLNAKLVELESEFNLLKGMNTDE